MKTRDCWHGIDKVKFHGFFEEDIAIRNDAGDFETRFRFRRQVFALIETKDGRIEHALPHNIRFKK